MGIRAKLIVGFFAVFVTIILFGAYVVVSIGELKSLTNRMYDNKLMTVSFAKSTLTSFILLDRDLKNLLADDPDPDAIEELEDSIELVVDELDVVTERADVERSQQLLVKINDEFEAMIEAFPDLFSEDNEAALEAYEAAKEAIEEDLNALIEYAAEDGYNYREAGNSIGDTTFWVAIAALASTLLIGLCVALALGRTIATPIARLTGVIGQVVNGETEIDLRDDQRKDEIGDIARSIKFLQGSLAETKRLQEQIEAARVKEEAEREQRRANEAEAANQRAADELRQIELKGEEQARLANEQERVASIIGEGLHALVQGNLNYRINEEMPPAAEQMKVNFNETSEQLSQTVAALKDKAVQLVETVTQMASASGDLSQRTQNQAASLEETAATMEQFSASVQHNAKSAMEARELSADTFENAQQGGSVMRETVAAMSEIEASSGEIGRIVQVIQEISFQTNLLALNAAVEAARAGEAGKGFAVVATEVRSLAQRANEAAKDIKDLIAASNQHVSSGVGLVNSTGAALDGIVNSASSTTQIVKDISDANEEQATGISEMTQAISEMDQATQRNAAMAEEGTMLAQSVEEIASQMMRELGFFVVGEMAENDDGQVALGDHHVELGQ